MEMITDDSFGVMIETLRDRFRIGEIPIARIVDDICHGSWKAYHSDSGRLISHE